jgi:alginate O-acetyltransferase complex protein AlgI
MLFNSYSFLFLFLPITLLIFYGCAHLRGERLAKLWLVVSSLFFYGCWNPVHLGLLLLSMLGNFYLGILIFRRSCALRSTRIPFFLGIAANLFTLGYFKYGNFFIENSNALFGTHWSGLQVVLPLGVSFFTFTQIAYLCDARSGKMGQGSFSDFLLFVTFFPHLIAGPVIHHSEMMPQFAQAATYRFRWENLAAGGAMFILGLGKKCLIADGMGPTAVKVFGAAQAGQSLFASDAWAGALAYTFQLYFDFSGYSDMAIGLAKLFGITLPLNFLSPYQAANIGEFWRRWHMTLSRFLRDYLYIPLGGNRVGPFRHYANLVSTMVLGGLWHGAAWTFVLWGALHGLLLASHRFWSERVKLPNGRCLWVCRALTFSVVVFGWVLFRSESLGAAGIMLSGMVHWGPQPDAGMPGLVKAKIWIWLALLLLGVWHLPNSAQLCGKLLPYGEIGRFELAALPERLKIYPGFWWAIVLMLILSLSVLTLSKTGEFLYYNF